MADEWGLDVAAFWRESRGLMLQRIAVLEESAVAALEDNLDVDLRRRAEREAHKLAGSLATFGFEQGTVIARRLEELLSGSQPLGDNDKLALSDTVVALAEIVEGEPAAASASAPVAGPRPLLLMVGPDPDLAHRVLEQARAQGLDGAAATDVGAAREAIIRRPPAVVILEPSGTADLDLVVELTRSDPPTPTLVLAPPGGGVARAEVARTPADAFLEPGMSPKTMVEMAQRARERAEEAATVLVVDDDPVALTITRALLAAKGFRAFALDDPHSFWATLEEVRPDLVMLDYDMPGLGGLDLCRMVRADETWAELPVIFLTAAGDNDVVRAVYAAGADDHLTKPVTEEDLVARLGNRLQRSRRRRSRPAPAEAPGLAAMAPAPPPSAPESSADRVDVLVVDDDEALGNLLVHALTTRGYSTRWLQDGAEAAALLGAPGTPPARVVLLDVGLPGLDGLSVLRSLAQHGTLGKARVIMVTLRSTEAEVLEALELGAYDHVAKPFSIPVLLQRVRLALESSPS